jgi:hypothetical protein
MPLNHRAMGKWSLSIRNVIAVNLGAQKARLIDQREAPERLLSTDSFHIFLSQRCHRLLQAASRFHITLNKFRLPLTNIPGRHAGIEALTGDCTTVLPLSGEVQLTSVLSYH